MTVMSLSMQRRQTYSKPTFSPPANNVMHCQPLDCDRCGGAETGDYFKFAPWTFVRVLTEEGQIARFVRPFTFLQTDGYDRLTPPIATFKNDLGS